MEPWSREPVGRFDELEIESELLRDNPLGDPHVRPLWVYLPPAYDAEPDRRFPSIYLIQGMTGQLDMWRNRTAFRPSTPERIDALFAEEGCPPALVVFVDCWTSYGGSQFIDSPGTGRYCEYLCEECVSFVDSRYRTLAERRAPRPDRQVERRLRRDGRADAAPRRLRRPRDPLRRCALRALLPP